MIRSPACTPLRLPWSSGRRLIETNAAIHRGTEPFARATRRCSRTTCTTNLSGLLVYLCERQRIGASLLPAPWRVESVSAATCTLVGPQIEGASRKRLTRVPSSWLYVLPLRVAEDLAACIRRYLLIEQHYRRMGAEWDPSILSED